MINLVYGAKGSGKTERIIAMANERVKESKGCVIYMTDKAEHSTSLSSAIRFINVKQYDLRDECCFLSFVRGLLAGNYDITDIDMDGPAKFMELPIDELEYTLKKLDEISIETGANFTLTISAEEVPPFMRKYI